MRNTKKIAVSVSAAALAGLMVFGGASAVAYLSDSETTTNTFTVGKVTTDLKEPHYPGNGSDEVRNLVPNEEVEKDPQVENTGENNMVAFLKVYSPVSLINVVSDDGATKSGLGLNEIFWMKDSTQGIGVHENGFALADGWVELTNKEKASAAEPYYQAVTNQDGITHYVAKTASEATVLINGARFYRLDAGTGEYIPIDHETAKSGAYDVYVQNFSNAGEPLGTYTAKDNSEVLAAIEAAKVYKAYVFGHDVEVKPTETTDAIFDKIQLKNVIEGEIDTQTQNIVIENYAIQSENIIDSGAALQTSGTMDQATLETIYDIFVNQATAGEGDQASNDLQENIERHDANITLNKDLNGDLAESSTQKISLHIDDAKIQVGEAVPTSIVTLLNGNNVAPGANGTGSVVYSTDNAAVASVNAATGEVTGEAIGTAHITATWRNAAGDADVVSATIEVTVVNDELYVLGLTYDKTELVASDTGNKTAIATAAKTGEALDKDSRGTVTYESSNPAVATVSADGTVTAVKQGTTVITATWADGTTVLAKDSVEITVQD